MSKAFVKETDDSDIEPADHAPAIPAGVKNYMTPEGHRCQQEELRRLQRENARLAQENEFLKRAAAYFARESR